MHLSGQIDDKNTSLTSGFRLTWRRMMVDMTVELRVLGDPDDVAQVLRVLDEHLELAWNGRTYPNRGGFGVRAYVDARLRRTVRVDAHQVDPQQAEVARPGRPGLPPAGGGW